MKKEFMEPKKTLALCFIPTNFDLQLHQMIRGLKTELNNSEATINYTYMLILSE